MMSFTDGELVKTLKEGEDIIGYSASLCFFWFNLSLQHRKPEILGKLRSFMLLILVKGFIAFFENWILKLAT